MISLCVERIMAKIKGTLVVPLLTDAPLEMREPRPTDSGKQQ